MGYTRYYEVTGQIDPQKFEKYSEDCKVICDEITKQTGHRLANWEGEDDPEFTSDEVRFNGVGDNAHETFALGKDSSGFNFTKTQRKPYDHHVLACLLLAKEYFGENIHVSSDGDNNDKEIESLISQLKRNNKINLILEN
jgi:hypothetical protein